MSRYAELTDTATTRLLETVQPLGAVTVTLATAVDGVVSTLPRMSPPESLPSTVEVLEAHFSVAERLMAAHKDFLLRVLSADAASPLVVPLQGEPVATATSTKV